MNPTTRRGFLADVSRGLVVAGLGSSLAGELGLTPAWAGDNPGELTFGAMEPLVRLLQETDPDKLLGVLVKKLNSGTELKELVKAAALANARTFGGDDYIGFHTMMALAPCLTMAGELPANEQALPVLKVLYRNSRRIQEKGGRKEESLHAVKPSDQLKDSSGTEVIRKFVHEKNRQAAEEALAAIALHSADEAFNELLPTVSEAPEVHRIVMVWRAWELLGVLGKEHAHTMLRQSIHYCVNAEGRNYMSRYGQIRDIVPKLLDQHKLLKREPGTKSGDTAWVKQLSRDIFRSSPAEAAGLAAEAIAAGYSGAAIAEAIRLAANELVLRDRGRPKNQTSPNKPEGSTHGDSIGVHASDSANAWCNIAAAANTRNGIISTILGAYQVAWDRIERGGDFLKWDEYPSREAAEKITTAEPEKLLALTEAAIRGNDQMAAAAAAARYGEGDNSPAPMFNLLLKYAISEDGALHAEKYYRTVSQSFAATRSAYRWKHVVSLARVSASAFGQPAPGVDAARRLMNG